MGVEVGSRNQGSRRTESTGTFRSPIQPASEAVAVLWAVRGRHESVDPGLQGCAGQWSLGVAELATELGLDRRTGGLWKVPGVTEATFRA